MARSDCQTVLNQELRLWEAKPPEELVSELADSRLYEVTFDAKPYQVEVQILENTDTYVHVLVSVFDGTLRRFVAPLSESFIRNKGN